VTGRCWIFPILLGAALHLRVPEPATRQEHRHHGRSVVPAIGAPWHAELRRSAKFSHRYHHYLIQQFAHLQIADKCRDEAIEYWQERPEPLANATRGWDVVDACPRCRKR
jgi:hypothetical protein